MAPPSGHGDYFSTSFAVSVSLYGAFSLSVTNNPDTGSTPTPGVGPDVYDAPAADTSNAGTVILPITLSGDDVAAWHELHG